MFQFVGLIISLVFLQVSSAYADDACSHWSARVTSMQGVVEIRKHTILQWVPAKLDDSLCAGDSLRTAPHSRATIHIQKETFMVLKERSTVRFSSNQEKENAFFSQLLNLFNGEAYFRSRQPRELGIETPFVNAMHEGTEFLVKVNRNSTQVVVFDGVVVASNTLGQVRVSEGQSALTLKGQAPAIGPRIELRDAVQWTLYYPPVIDYTATSQNASYSTLKPVLDRFQSNDLAGAFELLDNVNETERNSGYQVLYASMLLTVGQVEQAQQHLNQVQQASQQNANILALRSIIALAKSDQQQALKLAEQAQQVNPQAAAPKIALSYAYQSLFDIDKALNSATQAAQADPNNGLAWARVSEMELATGNVDASMEAASKAQTLNPKLAKTNTVLGFARLASLDLSEAEQSFRTAIKRDPSDPLARLGLGLAKIRQGHIKSGTKEMETAANLDPDNALIRSYLGKAYYEQRRGDIASTEYAIAKKLDPNDPTPWFYDAIYKQTVNRPVEALHDMQKAIELNDNRAVFRSSLLLDSDLAARSASLGRIYNNLEFQQLGLVEGWKAVGYDPSDFSAHRLLADNYSVLPRHEIARVSELLRSQLLQPINAAPLQPGLGESNLSILQGFGPSESSFNDFNHLFTRNGVYFQTDGVVGNNQTWGTDAALTGIFNNWSLSLGEFHFESDGVRSNSDVEHNLYNALAQVAVSPNLNMQVEYRHRRTESGQIIQEFNEQKPDFREEIDKDSVRIGMHYTFNPSSEIIGSFSLARAKTSIDDKVPLTNSPGFTNTQLSSEDIAYKIEVQQIYKQNNFKIIAGFGYQNIWVNNKDFSEAFITSGENAGRSQVISDDDTNSEGRFFKSYVYIPFNLSKRLLVTAGLSYDRLQLVGFSKTKNKFNWKFGGVWTPSNSTTIRFAAFKTLKEPYVDERTIEPTQIAGFNQFFDDANGSQSKRYGVGIDHKFTDDIRLGAESSWRDVDVIKMVNSNIVIQDNDEKLQRGYLFWTPDENWVISTEVINEGFTRDFDGNLSGPSALSTLTIPISVKRFYSNGLFWGVKGSFVRQEIADTRDDSEIRTTTQDQSDFFLADVELGYRFPRQYGKVSFKVNNIFDNRFYFQDFFYDQAQETSRFQPGRSILMRANINF